MYEEPYRWVEAVGNRRQYLDEQFKQGSPVVALSYAGGIVLLTVSRGTPKLYEIYDRLALAGMGHPADLEKLRFSLLEMAHIEGFNRSPSDVTGSRLMKYGLAPVIKQAFEEIFRAPLIVKILLAELGQRAEKDGFLTINYDGGFEEVQRCAALAATPSIQTEMTSYIAQAAPSSALSLQEAANVALRAWALGSMRQRVDQEGKDLQEEKAKPEESTTADSFPSADALYAHIKDHADTKMFECAVLEREVPGASTFRTLTSEEVSRLLPTSLQPSLR